MKRRDFVVAGTLAALGAPVLRAQTRVMHIGMLCNIGRDQAPPALETIKGLAAMGYVEGKNLVIEYRANGGVKERLTMQVRELLGLNLDLVITVGNIDPVRALVAEKAKLPVVFLAIDFDPVESGVVASYNRPGANYTGAYIAQSELAIKRFELAREVVPQARRMLMFYDASCVDQFEAVLRVAAKAQVEITSAGFKVPPYDYAAAFKQGRQAGVQALVGLNSPQFFQDRAQIAALALKDRLPAIGATSEVAGSGFLASYGAPFSKIAERAAAIAGRVLKGGKPAEIPVEQVNVFEFALNTKTAKALGVAIPQSILVRADKVIE
jgi:putative ABC transport system substrate-binding protein